jgi:exosortase A
MRGGVEERTLAALLTQATVDTSRRDLWRRRLVLLAICAAGVVICYWSTAVSIVSRWSSDPLAHGYLVVPAALYLAWDRRDRLVRTLPTPSYPLLTLLGLLAFVWLLGRISGTVVVEQVCLVGMLITLACGILGLKAGRVLLLPFAFLLFALPLADPLIPRLQILTAQFAVKMLTLSGVPVLLQGHVISIPSTAWNVAEACSGINYLTASLAIGCLYAAVSYRTWAYRLGFVVASLIVPLIANGIRVYATIVIAHLGGTQIAAGTRHYLFGWIVFAIMMVILFATCGGWTEAVEQLEAAAGTVGSKDAKSPALFVVVAAALLGSAPLVALSYDRFWSGRVEAVQVAPAAVSSPWTVVENAPFSWKPQFDRPGAELRVSYRRDRQQFIMMYVAVYGANQPGVKLVSGNSIVYDRASIVSSSTKRTVSLDGQSFRVNEITIADAPNLVIWTWYWANNEFTGSEHLAKAYLATERLLHGSNGSAAIAIATRAADGIEANDILTDFLSHLSLAATLTPRNSAR